MTNGSVKKKRGGRIAGFDPVPKLSKQLWQSAARSDVMARVALCLAAALIMALATQAWAPPFPYHEGETPTRDIVTRVAFQMPDTEAWRRAQENARSRARRAYRNNPLLLRELRAKLRSDLAVVLEAETLDENTAETWSHLLPRPVEDAALAKEENERRQQEWRRKFENFRFAMTGEGRLKFDAAVERAFADLEKRGLLDKLEEGGEYPGNRSEIVEYPENDWDARSTEEVKEVLIPFVKPKLQERLQRELQPLQSETQDRARLQARQTYLHDPQPMVQLRTTLIEQITSLARATEFDEKTAEVWKQFLPPPAPPAPPPAAAEATPKDAPPAENAADDEQQKQFEQFRNAVPDEPSLDALKTAVSAVLTEIEMRGLLVDLKSADEAPEGHREEIYVVSKDDPAARQIVAVKDVRLEDVKVKLREELEKKVGSLELAGRVFTWLERRLPTAVTLRYVAAPADKGGFDLTIAAVAYGWLENKLPITLQYDKDQSKVVREEAAAAVLQQDYNTQYHPGQDTLARAGLPLTKEAIATLKEEYKVSLANLTPLDMLSRMAAVIGMYLAIFTLCGLFVFHRYPALLSDMGRFTGLLVISLLTVTLAYVADNWKAELIPMLLFGMTVAICYHQELALMLSAAVALVVVLSLGHDVASFVIMTAATATAILLLGRVRSRVKLVYVGLCAGAVATLTTIGVSIVSLRPLNMALLTDAGLYGLWGIAAGFAMTGLLPFIENIFGILTEISLLELGDVAHPLLQELVRRAPGTYNHSINVASMAEAAAERIGSQGLLVRVGAYFHDIGKMLKPQYFVENQNSGDNRHESLLPAMSTLVIIAHVKDGAELAREHHLPQPIIDFIQQHHGTTLVEYFYRRASEDSERNPDSGEVDENTFRYPGPKPQSKEAGILMLADAVESASRVLVEPTPSRIESLVEEIAMKRLLDGQFDECGLTLRELRAVQDSLVKSLTAVYHGRVKYPDQLTA